VALFIYKELQFGIAN